MINMKKVSVIIFLFCTLALNLFADEKLTFTASAPDVVVEGDNFRLEYSVNSTDVKDLRIASNINGFDILAGPYRSTSRNVSIINGKQTSSSSVTFTYTLSALKAGTYTIPAASITAKGGEKLISNAITIKVLPPDQDANTGQSGSKGRSGAGNDRVSQSGNIADNDLFITATVSKTNVYEQEALLLTYKIYTRVDLRGFDNVKLPDFKGFHSQEVDLPQTKQFTQEHYNGRNYHTTVFRQFVLFPQQAGKLEIDPARFDASVARAVRSMDPFDAFFGGSSYVEVKKTLTTPKVIVNVKSLPANKPASFNGAVGSFNLTSNINTQNLKTNDAVTLKLTLSGAGNMKLIQAPEVKFPGDFEVYDPKVEDKVSLTQNGLSGNKVFEYLAIPRHAGEFEIPAVEFNYFDVKSKAYKTLKTDAYKLTVEKGQGNAEQVVSDFTNKESVKVLGNDIRYIKTGSTDYLKYDELFFGSLAYILYYIIPSMIFMIFVIAYRKQIENSKNITKSRTRKANKTAVKRMKTAAKLLTENKKEGFYDEVLKAMWGYVGDKLSIPVSELNKENIENRLIGRNVPEATVSSFLKLLDECEFARFAPGDMSQTMNQTYDSAMNIITEIENNLK